MSDKKADSDDKSPESHPLIPTDNNYLNEDEKNQSEDKKETPVNDVSVDIENLTKSATKTKFPPGNQVIKKL